MDDDGDAHLSDSKLQNLSMFPQRFTFSNRKVLLLQEDLFSGQVLILKKLLQTPHKWDHWDHYADRKAGGVQAAQGLVVKLPTDDV